MNSAPPAWLTNIQAPVLPPIVYAPPPPLAGFPYIPPNPSVLFANLPSQMLPSANTGVLSPQFNNEVTSNSFNSSVTNDNSVIQASDSSQDDLNVEIVDGIISKAQTLNPIENFIPIKYIGLGIVGLFLLSRLR